MGISGTIHELKMKRVLAWIGLVCIFTLALANFKNVLTSDVSVFMPETGSSVENRTEANVGLTVNIGVQKLSERRFGGFDSHSSVMFYPPCSGGAADSALFITLQLHIGGIHPHPGPSCCADICYAPKELMIRNGEHALLDESGDNAMREPEVTALR
jgi:hypothetical protein